MKVKRTILVGAAVTAWVLGGISTVLAQGPPPGGGGRQGPPPGGGGGGGRPPGGQEGGGDLHDLGKAADRFEAWKIAKLQGAETFSKYEEEVREKYQELIAKIEKATLEDRLAGSKARALLSQALGMHELAEGGGASVSEQLETLESELTAALTDDAKAETLTPALNKLQWMISETLIYGSKSEELSKAKVTSIHKKLLALEEKEANDSELKRLNEGASKIWKLIVKALKGRDD